MVSGASVMVWGAAAGALMVMDRHELKSLSYNKIVVVKTRGKTNIGQVYWLG